MAAKVKFAPLSSAFQAVSILGIILSVFMVRKISITWGFTLTIIFACMLVASFISMEKANPDVQLMPRPRK